MEIKGKKPCAQCPWKRNSLQGYTGGVDPYWFVDALARNDVHNCHKSVDKVCNGAAIALNNSCTSYRGELDAEKIRALGKSKEVFHFGYEFHAYHTNGAPYHDLLKRTMEGYIYTDEREGNK